jgi:hypothetical protein
VFDNYSSVTCTAVELDTQRLLTGYFMAGLKDVTCRQHQMTWVKGNPTTSRQSDPQDTGDELHVKVVLLYREKRMGTIHRSWCASWKTPSQTPHSEPDHQQLSR